MKYRHLSCPIHDATDTIIGDLPIMMNVAISELGRTGKDQLLSVPLSILTRKRRINPIEKTLSTDEAISHCHGQSLIADLVMAK
jgi:hypothetical protein